MPVQVQARKRAGFVEEEVALAIDISWLRSDNSNVYLQAEDVLWLR